MVHLLALQVLGKLLRPALGAENHVGLLDDSDRAKRHQVGIAGAKSDQIERWRLPETFPVIVQTAILGLGEATNQYNRKQGLYENNIRNRM